MTTLAILLLLLLLTVFLSAARAHADDTPPSPSTPAPSPPSDRARAAALAALDRALDRRTDAEGALAAVTACAAAAAERPDDLAVAERLVRARYFRAKRYLTGDDAQAEHARAVEDGLAALSRALGATLEDVEVLDDRRDDVPPAAVGALYWTALSYACTIESMSFFGQPGAARRFLRLVRRAVEIDESYFHAGPLRVLADFLREAPGIVGGDLDEARSHAQRAVELAPRFIENRVVLAEVLAEDDDPVKSRESLEAAVALAADGLPGCAPEQGFALARARALLAAATEDE